MRLPVLMFVLLTSSFAACAQAPTEFAPGAPERYGGINWIKMSTLTHGQRHIRASYEDMDIFWPTRISDKEKPDCSGDYTHPKVLVKKAPNYRVTREILWNEYRPKINARFHEICGVEHTGMMVAFFYFDTVYRKGDQLYLGVPSGSDNMPHYLPSFAHGIFMNKRDPHGNDSLELFAPTIFGYAGKGEHADYHILYPDRVDEGSGKTGLELLQAGYEDFPDFNFIDVVIWDLGVRELIAKRKQAEEDLVLKLMARGAVEMFSRQRACFDDGSCGYEDFPAMLID